jgi:hypothetical protein
MQEDLFAASPLRGFGNISGITAVEGPLHPNKARVHPIGGAKKFQFWLESAPKGTSRPELEVRFAAAMRKDVYEQRVIAQVGLAPDQPVGKALKLITKRIRSDLRKESEAMSTNQWNLFSSISTQLKTPITPPPPPNFDSPGTHGSTPEPQGLASALASLSCVLGSSSGGSRAKPSGASRAAGGTVRRATIHPKCAAFLPRPRA